MKQQINEIKRMQQLAGLNENEDNPYINDVVDGIHSFFKKYGGNNRAFKELNKLVFDIYQHYRDSIGIYSPENTKEEN